MAQPNPPAPEPWGVLYVPPRKDGRGRLCGNCVMWTAAEGGRCVIHARDLVVKRTEVCGYHVSGRPMPKWMDHPGMEPVDPELSGLEEVGSAGTKCGNCRYFSAAACARVQQPGAPRFTPAKVEANGCCAAWERRRRPGARLRGIAKS